MKNLCFWLFLMTVVLLLNGCGSDEITGSDKEYDSTNTGLFVKIDSLAPYSSANIDVVQNTDCDNDNTTFDPELFTDHNGTLTVSVSSASGYSTNIIAEFITLEGYDVKYNLTPGYLYTLTPPSISAKEYKLSLTIAKDATGTTSVQLIDVNTKLKFRREYEASGWNNAELPSYTASYTFHGRDNRSRTFEITGSITFNMGNYNYCSS